MRQSQCRLHRQASTAELDSESPCDRASSFALTSRSRYRAQTLPKSQLGECMARYCSAHVSVRTRWSPPKRSTRRAKVLQGRKVQKLGEQRFANVHAHPRGNPGKCAESVQIDTTPKMLGLTIARLMSRSLNPRALVQSTASHSCRVVVLARMYHQCTIGNISEAQACGNNHFCGGSVGIHLKIGQVAQMTGEGCTA